MIANSPPELGGAIEASARATGLERQMELVRKHVTEISEGKGSSENVSSLLDMIYTHIRRDQGVTLGYLPIIQYVCERLAGASTVVKKSTSKRGHCPDSARSAIVSILALTSPNPTKLHAEHVIVVPGPVISQLPPTQFPLGEALDGFFSNAQTAYRNQINPDLLQRLHRCTAIWKDVAALL